MLEIAKRGKPNFNLSTSQGQTRHGNKKGDKKFIRDQGEGKMKIS